MQATRRTGHYEQDRKLLDDAACAGERIEVVAIDLDVLGKEGR